MFEKYLSERIKKVPASFIREILKVTQNSDIISFAGGLPNPVSFPQEELKLSMDRITSKYGSKIYQYSTTCGLNSLREYIASRYKKNFNMDLNIDNIIITTGSQQALDLIGKCFINKNDKVMVENPSYLGLLQAFMTYEADFVQTKLNNDGLDIDELKDVMNKYSPKISYLIPNFQNPTGLTYTKENRKRVFDVIKDYDMILIQDDPYGELRFENNPPLPYIGQNQTDKNIYLSSFSKIVTPGMRLGYAIADKEIISNLEKAKQASDLHSNIFAQYLINDYLENNDLDKHIEKIKALYKKQADAMINAIQKYFPKNIKYTIPKGGMFCWVELEKNQSSMKLFEKAIKKQVAFVPGNPFYPDMKDINTFRLNYTNSDEKAIEEGIKRLAEAIKEL